MTYQGFFVRDNLGQLPNQNGTCWSSSPDIIILNQAPQSTLPYVGATGYGTDYGQNVVMNTPNYVYLRALNTNPAATASSPITGRAWFYFTESDLALWPQNWRGDCTTVAGNGVNYQSLVATGTAAATDPGVPGNPIAVTDQPFVWTPPPFKSTDPGTHYCLVSWVENTPVEPPTNPVASFGYMGSFDALVNFVLQHPNMGWRNTNDMASAGPTWSQTTGVSGPTQPAVFNIGIQCNNMPTDGQVGFDMPPPGTSGSGAHLPLTTIGNPNFQASVRITDWPGNATSSIVVNYQQGATAPQAGANIVVTLTTPATSMSTQTMMRVARGAPHLLQDHLVFANDVFGRPTVRLGIGPTKVVQVGSQTYNF